MKKHLSVHPIIWFPLQVFMTIPAIIFEMSLIYLFLGCSPERYATHGGGLIGAVSIAAICLVFIYQSEWWCQKLSNNITVVNFIIFAVANFALTWLNYFGELYLIKFLTNVSLEQAQVGVTLHQQLVFFTQSFNTNWFNGFQVIKGNAWSQMAVWYLISWLAWLPFGVPVMLNNSFVDDSKANTYLIVMGAIASMNFINLSKLNIMKYCDYKKITNNILDQIGIIGTISIILAIVEYIVIYYLSRWMMGASSVFQFFCSAVANNIAVCWISQAIVGETLGEWLYPILCKKKAGIIFYMLVMYTISFALLIPLFFLYHEVVYKIFMMKVLKQQDLGVFARQDFQYGFGVGNLYLVWNGLKFFSKTKAVKRNEQQVSESMSDS